MSEDLSHISQEGVRTHTQVLKDAVDSIYSVATAIKERVKEIRDEKRANNLEITLSRLEDKIDASEKSNSKVNPKSRELNNPEAKATKDLWNKYASGKQGNNIEITISTAKDAVKAGEKPSQVAIAIQHHSPATQGMSQKQSQLLAKQTVGTAQALQNPAKVTKALRVNSPAIKPAAKIGR
jgi:hypothetical protein